MSVLVNPSFTIYKWGLRGSKLYRRVFVIENTNISCTKVKYNPFIVLFLCFMDPV